MNITSEMKSRKIKVIHVITRFDKGGSAENTYLTVRDLDKTKYEIWLIYGSSCYSQMGLSEKIAVEKNICTAKAQGVHLINLPNLIRDINPLKDIPAFFSLFRIFCKTKPLIVHTHTSKAGFLGRWAACLARVPYVVHTPHGHVFWGYFKKRTATIFILLECLTAKISDKLIMLSQREQEDHQSVRIAPGHKFVIIHSGIDFVSFFQDFYNPANLKSRLGIPSDAFVIGSVGRLTSIKGHQFLLEAMSSLKARLPNLFCVLLGDGELRSELEDMASQFGIKDRVRFLGWRSNVAKILATFDIFVFPSLNEGMGKALVEAMAMGKPIVASNVGGIANLVTDRENGLLIPPGNVDFLAKSIELLYQNENMRHILGENSKAISHQYSSKLMIQKLEALYAELLQE